MKLKKLNMTYKIMIAMILGVIVGTIGKEKVEGIKILGDIFLRLIQMSIIFLVMGQIIEAVGNLNPKELGKQGIKVITIFFVTSVLAAALGILFAFIFKPGIGLKVGSINNIDSLKEANIGTMSELLLGFFSNNIVKSMSDGVIVQVIVFALLFGLALSFYRNENKDSKLINIISEFNNVILKMISLIMKIAPIGIFSLITSTIGQNGIDVVIPLSKYILIYALATLIYLLLFFIVSSSYCKINLISLIKGMFGISVMALATTSSAVTLPTEMKDAKEKLGISENVNKLVLPLGMSLNSNGSAMHMAFTIITISQIYNITYSPSEYAYIALLATLISLANAVVPGAGLISLAIIVPQLGLPLEAVAIFAGVEWFVGMLRTILNVDSDTLTALIVAKGSNDIDYSVYR